MFSSLLRKAFAPSAAGRFCTLITDAAAATNTPAAATAILSNPNTTTTTSSSDAAIIPLSGQFQPQYQTARQVWIENLDTVAEQKRGLLELHPDVFAVAPRIDVIHRNVEWQRKYRFVSFATTKSRAEAHGGGRKPWPQKGLGRARHGSIRSPIWRGGGIAHGPRSPTTHFYMLPVHQRVLGLTSALSVKLAQNDLHVIDRLDLPVDDPEFVRQLIENRVWGPSVLFVDSSDIVSRNVTVATDAINHVHVMPAYGLNVYAMLKYDTLVLTVDAVERIQDKLLYHMNRADAKEQSLKFKLNQ